MLVSNSRKVSHEHPKRNTAMLNLFELRLQLSVMFEKICLLTKPLQLTTAVCCHYLSGCSSAAWTHSCEHCNILVP